MLKWGNDMGRKPGLGRGEAEVLRHVADHCPITVRETADHFAATKGHTKTTILNVMERLREKGFLTREPVDGLYRYSPSRPAAGMLRDLVRDFVDEMLGGSLEPFAAYLAENPPVSEAEIARLRATLVLLENETRQDEAKEKKP
jgi:predicted transcriptional regulator